jgi:methionine-rich copper-binding protein CopC
MTPSIRPLGDFRRSAPRLRLFGLLLAMLLSPAAARAHAIIVASKPAVNASLPQGPLEIALTFNSRIDPGLSRLDLVGPDGQDQRLTIAPDSPPGAMVAHASTNAAGRWKVRWLALSTDGHITRGEIPFAVTGKTSP